MLFLGGSSYLHAKALVGTLLGYFALHLECVVHSPSHPEIQYNRPRHLVCPTPGLSVCKYRRELWEPLIKSNAKVYNFVQVGVKI